MSELLAIAGLTAGMVVWGLLMARREQDRREAGIEASCTGCAAACHRRDEPAAACDVSPGG